MFPKEFEERMKELLKNEYEAFESALNEAPVKAFHVNTKKISVEDFLKINPFDTEKIPYAKNGFYFSDGKIGNHPYHHAGMIYVQEPSAQAPVNCIKPEKDWKVLDMCAAPGGKSSQIACQIPNGFLFSNEYVSSRCKILSGNIERMGYENTAVINCDAQTIGKNFTEYFDLIICDAPCSGEGMFRKEENAVSEWSLENVEKCAIRQLEIIENIKNALKKGGTLVYSTCTYSLEENEELIKTFLENNPDFYLTETPEEIKNNSSQDIGNMEYTRRFYPHINKGEGQFVAVLKKKEGENTPKEIKDTLLPLTKQEEKIVCEFLDETLTSYDKKKIKKHNDSIIYIDEDIKIPKVPVFLCGVKLGTVQKNYFQPHHQLFTALGHLFRKKINLSLKEAEKYLHGETIPCEFNKGWCAVCIEDVAMGGGKAVNKTLKNHYPKGLRTL